MDEHKTKELLNLYNEIKNKGTFSYLRKLEHFKKSEYYKFYLFLKANRQVLGIVKYNYNKLIKLVDYHNSAESHSKLWNDTNPRYRWKQQRDITMLLFNYFSSVFAAVDFSRSNMKKYITSNPEVSNIFNISKEKYFDCNPQHKFIQGLRNFTSHNSYLRVSSEVFFENGNERRSIYLLKDELLESNKWTGLSKNFLCAQESKIYIIDIIKNHLPLFIDFQNWAYLSLLQVDSDFTLKFRNELIDILDFAEKVNMARTSLPFNKSYIKYLDLIIGESEKRCTQKFKPASANL